MKLGLRETILAVLAALLSMVPAQGQNQPEQRPQMAEDVFKNVQVLRGLTVNEFMETMGFFSASTLLNCTDCHTSESSSGWGKYADETPMKQMARKMVLMQRGINQSSFGGRRMITCYSCHRGDEIPRLTPNLTEMYSTPPLQEPDQVLDQPPGAPSAESLLDNYIRALGGAQKLAGMTSLVAKGLYEGSPVSLITGQSPVEIFAKAPNQRTMIIHSRAGDATSACNGHAAWSAEPTLYSPVPVLSLTGTDLDAAQVEAELTFPARIKQTLTNWRVGFPFSIDNHEVQVVQGTSAGHLPVKLYLDSKSGLLVRLVRYTNLPVGLDPFQTDYADYRDVSGIQIPFRITITWVGGRTTIKLSDVKLNLPIAEAKFAKPSPPAPPETVPSR